MLYFSLNNFKKDNTTFMKKCCSCKKQFHLSNFYKSSKGYLDSLCKNCRKEYSKNWKLKNPLKNKKHHKKRFKKQRENLTDKYIVNHLINDKLKIIEVNEVKNHEDLISIYAKNVQLKREIKKWKTLKRI